MVHTLRPLSLGKLLDETFDIYRRNFVLFTGISAVPNIAFFLVMLPWMGWNLRDLESMGIAGLFVFVGMIFVSMLSGAIATAATTLGVSDIYLDRPTSMVACFSRIGAKALRVFYVSFVVGLIVGFGMLLCFLPGIYWSGVYGIAIPAVVLENITGNESLKRSSYLTSGSVGRVIFVYFLTTIFRIGLEYAFKAGMTAFGLTAFQDTGFTGQTLRLILSTVGSILFGPVTAIALTLVYYDQRVRKEAFDIEHMISMMGGPEKMAQETSAS